MKKLLLIAMAALSFQPAFGAEKPKVGELTLGRHTDPETIAYILAYGDWRINNNKKWAENCLIDYFKLESGHFDRLFRSRLLAGIRISAITLTKIEDKKGNNNGRVDMSFEATDPNGKVFPAGNVICEFEE